MQMPGRSGGTRSTQTTLAEINVTPLVDVMLVLLIVFMVSAPLMQQGVQVNLPRANAGTMDEVPNQIVLMVDKKKRNAMNDDKVEKGTLKKRLTAIASVRPDVQVFVQADSGVDYGFIARVIAEVKQSGIQRVGLVTQPGSKDDSL